MSIPRREEPETGNGGHPDPAFAAGDRLKAADEKLAKNYTPQNFIDRQILDIELKQEGLNAKRDAGKATLSDDRAEGELLREAEKMQELKSAIAGKTPEEASALVAKTFGNAYDASRAQAGMALYAGERTGISAARSAASIISSPFNSIADPAQPAPAPAVKPDSRPEWNRNAGAFAPAIPLGAQPGG